MSNLEIIKDSFIKHFTNFINEISELKQFIFIKENKNIIFLALNINAKKLIKFFIDDILIYEDKIKNKDEDFFLNFNYANKYSEFSNNKYFIKIFEFKENWKFLNQNNKDVIISYMLLLCKISRAYNNEFNKL